MRNISTLALRAGLLSSLVVAPAAFAQSVSITAGPPATQDFDTLATSGTTNSTLPNGWYLLETGTAANNQYAAGDGSSNTGNTYSFGTGTAADRAFGSLQSGALIPVIGARLQNDTGAPLTSLNVAYTGEQWRIGTAGREDRLDFQYSTDATGLGNGTWVDANALDFVAPVTTGSGPLDGNAKANRTAKSATITGFTVAPGASIWIRWNDFNATNADDGLAIDGVSIGIGADVPPTVISTAPGNGATNVAVAANLTINFSEPVQLAIPAITVACATSGSHALTGPAGPAASYVLDPAVDFGFSETCTVTVPASAVTDTDGTADNMAADFVYSFTTSADLAPTVATTSPANGASNVALASTVLINFSEPVTTAGTWYTIACATSGAHPATSTGGPTSYTLDPTTDFAAGESCTVTVLASQVTDQDGAPTAMAANHVFSFNTTLGTGGYWDSIDASSPTTLRTTIHARIRNHTPFPYTATTTDVWDILELADEDPSNPNRILDVYRNRTYTKVTDRSGGTSSAFYNREHTWPNSHGFNDVTSLDGGPYAPYTDCHMLYLSAADYNSTRGNDPYGNCASCTELTTDVNNGSGGGTGVYPGNSNWTGNAGGVGVFEVWNRRKGDMARAILYMDVRYEGDTSGAGQREPDLIATDNPALITTTPSGQYSATGHMGLLTQLIAWHFADPPDLREAMRNDVIQSFQGNRNPFIDHPEWVACLYQNQCTATPVDPLFSNGFE